MKPIHLMLALALLSCGRKDVPHPDGVTHFMVPADVHKSPDSAPDPEPDPVPEPPPEVPTIPPQNEEKGSPPDPSTAEAGARLLFEAIKADDPSLARDFFFPGPAFDLVKNMDDPANYYRKLTRWYDEDIHDEHERYWGVDTMEFDSFELGNCQWKEPYTQGNKIPYWACRNSRLVVKTATKKFDFKIKTIINWGDRWYVIHLGPSRL